MLNACSEVAESTAAESESEDIRARWLTSEEPLIYSIFLPKQENAAGSLDCQWSYSCTGLHVSAVQNDELVRLIFRSMQVNS